MSKFRGQPTKEETLKLAPVERVWLTQADIQGMMGVGYDYIKNLKARGKFPPPSHFIGSEARWRRDDVLDFLNSLANELAEKQGLNREEWERQRREEVAARCRHMRECRKSATAAASAARV